MVRVVSFFGVSFSFDAFPSPQSPAVADHVQLQSPAAVRAPDSAERSSIPVSTSLADTEEGANLEVAALTEAGEAVPVEADTLDAFAPEPPAVPLACGHAGKEGAGR